MGIPTSIAPVSRQLSKGQVERLLLGASVAIEKISGSGGRHTQSTQSECKKRIRDVHVRYTSLNKITVRKILDRCWNLMEY